MQAGITIVIAYEIEFVDFFLNSCNLIAYDSKPNLNVMFLRDYRIYFL